MSLSSQEHDNLTRWKEGRKGFYEVYYLKWNDLANQRAVWLRYTLLAPINRPPEVSAWAIVFDAKNPAANFGLKKTYPISEARIEREFFYFSAGPSAIFDAGCRGELSDARNALSWEIKFEDPSQALRHYPAPLYWGSFPKTKFLAPYVTMRVSGEFIHNGQPSNLDKLPAHQAHIWGTEMGHSWYWGNCNTFEEDPNFWFEGFSARMNFGEKQTPPFNVFAFHWEDNLYRLGNPLHWIRNKSEGALDRWHIEGRTGDLLFVGDVRTQPEQMAGVHYEDTNGSDRFCHNTKTADMTVQVFREKKSGWELLKTLIAVKSAAFEVVQPTLDPRVRLLIP